MARDSKHHSTPRASMASPRDLGTWACLYLRSGKTPLGLLTRNSARQRMDWKGVMWNPPSLIPRLPSFPVVTLSVLTVFEWTRKSEAGHPTRSSELGGGTDGYPCLYGRCSWCSCDSCLSACSGQVRFKDIGLKDIS